MFVGTLLTIICINGASGFVKNQDVQMTKDLMWNPPVGREEWTQSLLLFAKDDSEENENASSTPTNPIKEKLCARNKGIYEAKCQKFQRNSPEETSVALALKVDYCTPRLLPLITKEPCSRPKAAEQFAHLCGVVKTCSYLEKEIQERLLICKNHWGYYKNNCSLSDTAMNQATEKACEIYNGMCRKFQVTLLDYFEEFEAVYKAYAKFGMREKVGAEEYFCAYYRTACVEVEI